MTIELENALTEAVKNLHEAGYSKTKITEIVATVLPTRDTIQRSINAAIRDIDLVVSYLSGATQKDIIAKTGTKKSMITPRVQHGIRVLHRASQLQNNPLQIPDKRKKITPLILSAITALAERTKQSILSGDIDVQKIR